MPTVELKSSSVARLYVEYSIKTDIDKNQSTTTMTMKVDTVGASTNIGPWGDWNGSYLGTTSDTFNGEIPNFSGTRVLKTTVKTVTHNSEGKADRLKVDWKWGVNSSWGGMVIPSGTFYIDLPTIPRATQPTLSANAVQTGEAVTINTPRASSSFTHTLKYTVGKATGTIATKVTTSYKWTVPRTLAEQFPNALVGDCVIECITYSGSNVVGSKTVKLTLQVNVLDTPTINSIVATEKTEGVAEKFGAFIRGQSKVGIEIQASGIYGSTIKAYRSEFQNVVYNSATFEAQLLSSGQLTIDVTVADSRGVTKSLTRNINVLDYLSPTINNFSVSRCNELGEADDEGTYAKVNIDFSITPLNEKNDKSYKVEYKPSESETWTTLISGSVYTYQDSYISSQGIFSTDNVYDFRLTITDFFGPISALATLASANVPIDFHRSGRGVAIGKVAQTENLFDVGLESSFDKQVDFLGEMVAHGPTQFMAQVTFDTPPLIGIPQINEGSINDIKTTGTYYLMNNVTDRPVNANGWLEVFTFKDTNIYQRYTTYTGKKYERIMDASTWQDWCGYFEYQSCKYTKYIDGRLECTMVASVPGNFNTQVVANLYQLAYEIASVVPQNVGFTSVDSIELYPSIDNANSTFMLSNIASVSVANKIVTIKYRLARQTQGQVTVKNTFNIKGKWK